MHAFSIRHISLSVSGHHLDDRQYSPSLSLPASKDEFRNQCCVHSNDHSSPALARPPPSPPGTEWRCGLEYLGCTIWPTPTPQPGAKIAGGAVRRTPAPSCYRADP